MVIKLNQLRTGMKVQCSSGKFYYVVEDWCFKDPEDQTYKCNAVLVACDPADENRFYGLLNYDEDGKLWGLDECEWNIEKVFIFTGDDLNVMGQPDAEDWIEVTEPVQLSQTYLTKYFKKFE